MHLFSFDYFLFLNSFYNSMKQCFIIGLPLIELHFNFRTESSEPAVRGVSVATNTEEVAGPEVLVVSVATNTEEVAGPEVLGVSVATNTEEVTGPCTRDIGTDTDSIPRTSVGTNTAVSTKEVGVETTRMQTVSVATSSSSSPPPSPPVSIPSAAAPGIPVGKREKSK